MTAGAPSLVTVQVMCLPEWAAGIRVTLAGTATRPSRGCGGHDPPAGPFSVTRPASPGPVAAIVARRCGSRGQPGPPNPSSFRVRRFIGPGPGSGRGADSDGIAPTPPAAGGGAAAALAAALLVTDTLTEPDSEFGCGVGGQDK